MPTFIVESYGSHGAVADQRSRAQRAAELGVGIRYVRTTVLPGDETLFHLFEASSGEALGAAVLAAQLDCDRLIEVFESTNPG